jgi:serine/threonine protein kinase
VNDNDEACISDFGLSRILEVTGFTTKSVGGTCRWMAQELIAPDEDDEESTPRVTMESDVWAFSMTVIEVKLPLTISLANNLMHSPDIDGPASIHHYQV